MAKSVDPKQTVLWGQSDLGLHCLLRPNCLNTQNFYGVCRQSYDEAFFNVSPENDFVRGGQLQ